MIIGSSNINMTGSSNVSSSRKITEELNVWNNSSSGSLPSSVSDRGVTSTGILVDINDFTSSTIKINGSMQSSTTAISETGEEEPLMTKEELKIRMIETFLSRLTGKKIKLNVPKLKLSQEGYDDKGNRLASMNLVSLAPSQGSGFGLIYNRTETQIERSRVSFEAQGTVRTSDGREINLNLNFNVDQQIVKNSNFQLRIGEALKDPLVINFGSPLAGFTDKTMNFDLDYDGTKDNIQMLNSSSGYLALDKDGNGKIDDGRELFGPRTDDGYSELAAYDDDKNGWIDEADSIFDHLKIWYHDESGNSQLVALTDKNVGAIYLGNVDTQMNLYGNDNMSGVLRKSGLVLLENGESRVMQELDLRI